MHTVTGTITNIYYHDQRNFGTIKFCTSRTELTKKLQSLGPDILDPKTTPQDFLSIVSAQKNPSTTNVCKFLMNQAKVSGVGNYILAEGLYRANIDPFASLEELDENQRGLLFQQLQQIAAESYRSQGMTRRAGGSYRDVQGNKGTFVFQLQVYGRKVCTKGDPVYQEVDGPHGRTIWYTERQLFMPRHMRNVTDSEDGPTTLTHSLPLVISTTTTVDDTVSMGETKSDGPTRSDALLQQQACLTSTLTDDGWKRVLSDCMASQSFLQLLDFLQDEKRKGNTIYPPEDKIFSALNLCPFDKVKVVIVGQDPYHGRGQGHGLAFSVRPGVRIPPSLRNVFNEAMDDVGIDTPKSGYLKCWAEQGVLLLNAVLTVREGEANSHANKGWEAFTSVIIETLNREKDGLVFLLWGAPAAKMANTVNASKHTIIHTSHPSPLGATKTARPFLGSRCFSRANDAIVRTGKDPIDWNVR
jgi:uracil-DNA glycosylase